MIKWIVISFFFSVPILLASDQSSPGSKHKSGEEEKAVVSGPVVEVRDIPPDFKMPTQLWETIMASDKKIDGHAGDKEDKGDHSTGETKKKDDVLVVWLPIEVTFLAKRPGILLYEWVQYKLPRGGGTLDLSKIAVGEKGSFYLNFNLAEFSNRPGVKVFFLSNSKKRRIDGEVYGSGCNVYLDVTDAVQKSLSGEGLKFNITGNRHVSAMGGHFIFVQAEKDKVYLSHVEFGDTKNREYLCRI